MSSIVKVENLVKYYGTEGNIVKAVDHTDLEIERGKFTAIIGRSGSGKSTLLHLLGGLDVPDSGKVFIEEKDMYALRGDALAAFRREKIGFIFQDFNLIPSLTVWENVVLPLGLAGKKVKENDVSDVLKNIGIDDKKNALPSTLSGGQKQRCAIARALVSSPAIILADEPTGNLDSQTEREVMGILKKCVRDYGQTLIMITHDEGIAQMADVVVMIEDGKVVK
ncbi:ABC transporter ATP-binding protein [Roseburia sp. 1XD42-69]|uniref:ABC transporter ATP-binding protein n=1 Tax=Roseburia sp. 1XD42-69 TaxID=2320088 RepID=UPI000EA266CD|nr:ABC transporter ATP-binding protein [Roseburia sp. 1XD42-69]RKJ62463.1 ABC transporter ATP-binding protein [Roseburia sp. 1XD42-69]